MNIYLKLLLMASLIGISWTIPDYIVPKAQIRAFYPKGFQASIPAEEGMTLFVFHANLNEEIDPYENGEWSLQVKRPRNGRYIVRDDVTPLKFGDTIYYWTYVVYKGRGYHEEDGIHVVRKYANKTGGAIAVQPNNGLPKASAAELAYGSPPKASAPKYDSELGYGSPPKASAPKYGTDPGYGSPPKYGTDLGYGSPPKASGPKYGTDLGYGSPPKTSAPKYGTDLGYGSPPKASAPKYGTDLGYGSPPKASAPKYDSEPAYGNPPKASQPAYEVQSRSSAQKYDSEPAYGNPPKASQPAYEVQSRSSAQKYDSEPAYGNPPKASQPAYEVLPPKYDSEPAYGNPPKASQPAYEVIPVPRADCKLSQTVYNKGIPAPCADEIIFEEEFNGNRLDSNIWTQEKRFGYNPDYEFVMYLDSANVLKISDSSAIIKPVETVDIYRKVQPNSELNLGVECTGELETDECEHKRNSFDIVPPFVSSRFNTKNHFSFKYGRVEIRAKMPNADWVIPLMLLEPMEHIYGKKDYYSGQLRVGFTRSNGDGSSCDLFGGAILNSREPFRYDKLCQKSCSDRNNSDWSKNYHVYSLMWTPEGISVSVDSSEYCTITPDSKFSDIKVNGKELPNREKLAQGTDMAPFDVEFFLTLGYSIGGCNDFPDNVSEWSQTKPWHNCKPGSSKKMWEAMKQRQIPSWLNNNAEFKIDYVRVYSI